MAELTIILIGPMCAGKSTVAKLLAESLGIENFAVDDHRWNYYEQTDYDKAKAARIIEAEGMVALLNYMKPFEAFAVEKIMAEKSNCVIDFGAGHSVHEDETLFKRVRDALSQCQNVVLLLPSADLDESTQILNARFTELLQREVGSVDPNLLDLNEHFVKHPSNHTLAKLVVYTNGKSPDETANEIIGRVQLKGRKDD
ncbi:MAG: shikimate kinase [Anaerolineales bacterium]